MLTNFEPSQGSYISFYVKPKINIDPIKTTINKNVSSKDLISPGHVFPIVAKDGGVLVRAGHTEASVDISKLAKCGSSAVICEIMNVDGTMAKGKQLFTFAKKA